MTPRLLLKARRRARERGAALFVVVMMITMLMGIGMFAARSASLSTAASGFERQMTQTHYVAQYAILTATAELSTPRKQAYIRQAQTKPDALCSKALVDNVTNFSCYRFGYANLEKQMQVTNPGQTFIVPTDTTNKIPGSLGIADLEADWIIEMTDTAPTALPIPGMPQSSTGLGYWSVTLTATGQVRPRSTGAVATQTSATTASLETTRAHLIVGPLPR